MAPSICGAKTTTLGQEVICFRVEGHDGVHTGPRLIRPNHEWTASRIKGGDAR